MTRTEYRHGQRETATRWKTSTDTLPQPARRVAPYVAKDGTAGVQEYPFCLPVEFADHNLLPEVRGEALALFRELAISWHAGVRAGPSNHLLSSQVQCVNALGQMAHDPDRLGRAFAQVLDIGEVLQVEAGRYLTFEYIGPTDFFGECRNGERVRGARCTSVDAAFLHRTSAGVTELVLVEWKYTEDYGQPRRPDPRKDAVRRRRYFAAWQAPGGPIRSDVLPFEDILDEPFYQLVRQQLLAHELEKAHVLGADVVRVVHVAPAGNDAYQASLVRDSHRALGSTVSDVWQQLLRRPDRFTPMDSAAFLDPAVTSPEYVARYGSPAEARAA